MKFRLLKRQKLNVKNTVYMDKYHCPSPLLHKECNVESNIKLVNFDILIFTYSCALSFILSRLKLIKHLKSHSMLLLFKKKYIYIYLYVFVFQEATEVLF